MANQNIIRFSEEFQEPTDKYIGRMIDFVKKNVKPDDKILIALSGGVDSSTVTTLAHRAVPNKIHPLFIDTGYMRIIGGKKEAEIIAETFKDMPNLEILDKSDYFYERTFGIKDANEKRLAFRKAYDEVLNTEAVKLGCNVHMDGTIKPDIIETVKKVKPQSNVDNVFLFEKKIEPLASLYKFQVRKCAEVLKIPDPYRQPFPGPGLSVRVVGEINPEKLEAERTANAIVEEGVEDLFEKHYGKPFLYDEVLGERIPFQYFAATFDYKRDHNLHDKEREIKKYTESLIGKRVDVDILESKATGVIYEGEESRRVYSPVVALETDEPVDTPLLEHLGNAIPERFGVSRVLHQIKPGFGKYAMSIRNVKSTDAVTAKPLINFPLYLSIASEIQNECHGVGPVFQDITSKPPATIEYE